MNQILKGIVFIASALFSVQASAAPVACASNGSFASLRATNAAGGCYIEDQLFSNFTFNSSATGTGATPVSANDFLYTAIEMAPDAVGFQFDFTLSALPGRTGNISIGWLVRGPNIISNHLVLDATRTGTAAAIAQTSYCKGGPVAGCPAASLGELETYRGYWGADPEDAHFFDPVQILGVSTNLTVVATTGSATITGLRQIIDPPPGVPEPASLALTGGALVSLFFIQRRRS